MEPRGVGSGFFVMVLLTLMVTLVLSRFTPLNPGGMLLLFSLAWPLLGAAGAAYGLGTGRGGIAGALVAVPMLLYIPAALLRLYTPGDSWWTPATAVVAASTLSLAAPLVLLASAPALGDRSASLRRTLRAAASYALIALAWTWSLTSVPDLSP